MSGSLEGRMVGSLRIGRAVGRGGMGAVYEAVDENLGRSVALKLLLRPETTNADAVDAARRLRDEARAAARLRHPGLVIIFDAGEDRALGPFIVYEYLPRGSLRHRLDTEGPLIFSDAFRLVAEPLLGALEVLHDAGVMHRDVKPENLLEGSDGTYKLGDLGLALFEGREARTQTGTFIGTPGYMAPECLIHERPEPHPSSDLYSAALVIVEAVTGRHLFAGATVADRLTAQLRDDVTPRRLTNLGLPPAPAVILARALSRTPAERPQSASSFLDDLTTSQSSPESVPTRLNAATPPRKAPRPSARRWLPAACAIVMLLTCFLLLHRRWREDRPPDTQAGADYETLREELVSLTTTLSEAGPLPEPDTFLRYWDVLSELLALAPRRSPDYPATVGLVGEVPSALPLHHAGQALLARGNRNGELARDELRATLSAHAEALTRAGNGLAPRHLALRTFLLHQYLENHETVETKSLEDILCADEVFVAGLPRTVRVSSWAVHHRLYRNVRRARALLQAKDLEAFEALAPAISLVARNPTIPPGVRPPIAELLAGLARAWRRADEGAPHRVLEQWGEGALPRPASLEAYRADVTRMGDEAVARSRKALALRRTVLELAGRLLSHLNVHTIKRKERELQKAVDQAIPGLRQPYWALWAATHTSSVASPRLQEEFVHVGSAIASLRKMASDCVVIKQSWGVGFRASTLLIEGLERVESLVGPGMTAELEGRVARTGVTWLSTAARADWSLVSSWNERIMPLLDSNVTSRLLFESKCLEVEKENDEAVSLSARAFSDAARLLEVEPVADLEGPPAWNGRWALLLAAFRLLGIQRLDFHHYPDLERASDRVLDLLEHRGVTSSSPPRFRRLRARAAINHASSLRGRKIRRLPTRVRTILEEARQQKDIEGLEKRADDLLEWADR